MPKKTRFRIKGGFLAAATILISLGLGDVSSFADSPATPARTPEQKNQAEIRQRFGFASSDAAVDAADSDPNAVTNWLQIPLTQSEDREMGRRMNVARAIKTMTSDAENGAFAELGSATIDHAGGGTAIFGVTRDTPLVRLHLASYLPPNTPFSVTTVPNSWASLVSLSKQVERDRAELISNDIGFVSVEHRWADDNVRLSYNRDISRPDVESFLRGKYGTGISPRAVTGTELPSLAWSRVATTGPLLGGQRIKSIQGSSISLCTATGAARRTTDNTYWLITAGHCGMDHTTWHQGLTTGNVVGTNDVSSFWDNASTPCDCLAAHFLTAAVANNYVLDAFTQLQAETSNASTSFYGPGVPACFSGASPDIRGYGVVCGKMVSGLTIDATATIDGITHTTTLTDQVNTDMQVCEGDSGGSVTTGATWDGIVSGAVFGANPCGTTMWFTKSFYIAGYNMVMLTYDP
jgi:hypothetical protein